MVPRMIPQNSGLKTIWVTVLPIRIGDPGGSPGVKGKWQKLNFGVVNFAMPLRNPIEITNMELYLQIRYSEKVCHKKEN